MASAEGKVIDVSTLDSGFKFEVMKEPGGEHITRCFACGTCTAGCPIRDVDDRYNPRKIIRMALLGMKERVLSSDFIWLCSGCYTCQERCPQDVRITDLMTAMKNIAVREGYVPASYKAQVTLLKEHGRLYEIGEFENKKRAKVGLPPISETAEEVAKILATTGVDKLGS